MKREYIMRGKRMEIDELDQVLAVKQKDHAGAQDQALQTFGETAQLHSDGEREAFEQAGWVFVQPADDLLRAFEAHTPVRGAEAVQRVFVQPSGRMMLGTDRLSVRLRPDLSEQDARAALDAQGLEVLGRLKFAPNLFEVRTAPGTDFLQASVDLSQRPEFLFAEPQFLEHLPGRLTPTDPEYNQQWHLHNTGQDGGTPGADIHAEQAWDMTRGAGARLAVIDNGMDVAHPDLAAATAATSGYFNVDGMGNTVFTQGLMGFPDNGHGSFCAGMALARAGNAQGGCGVANEAELVALGCLVDQVGTQATLARTIAYATDPTQEVASANPADGADVIACSLGPSSAADWVMTGVLQAAIDFAVASGRGGLGTPIFWAVTNGNHPINLDEVCAYPNTIAVARSTRDDLEDNAGFGPELDFLATGVDVRSTVSGGGYGNATGTSFAAPTAAGVGALILSLNQNLTWQQVRQIMRDTCDKVGGVPYDAAGRNDDYGFGRVNAARAVCNAARVVHLDTPTVAFNDVPEGERTARAIVFSVQTCQAATFQIVSGPTLTSGPGSFGTLPSPTAALAATTDLSARQARLWLTFTGTHDGDIASGTVTVRLVETGEEWTIPLSANTIARITVGAVLVLDQSASMQQPSGLAAFPTRNDVLKFAAPVFVNVLQEHNGVGIVAFDQDAYDRMAVQPVGPVSAFDPVRANALSAIAAHTPNPAGNTSIGDGVERAHNLLTAATGFDQLATIVFTDGFETADKRIADVAPLIGERVFAIGLGTPDQIQPAALTALTNGTGGQLLLTGTIGPDDLFLLSKYYLQILAGVTNHDIVRDPQDAIAPGMTHRIGFDMNEADISLDAILLAETDLPVLRYALETPAGDRITPASAGPGTGVEYVAARGVRMFRGALPVPVGAAGAAAGRWHAVLEVDEAAFKRYLASLANYPEQAQKVKAHGVRYTLNVQSYSGLRLQASLGQDSNQPGATLTLRAVLTEYGLPVPASRANVRAEFKLPDGSGGTLVMAEETAGSGVFTASMKAPLAGVYPLRVLAAGKSMRGREFTREHLLTGAVWAGGDNPTTGRPDPGAQTEQVCSLLACMLGKPVLSSELEHKLKDIGLDLDAFRRCLSGWCSPRDPAVQPAFEAPAAKGGGAPPAGPELVAAANQLILQLARQLGRQT
jgi:thermitase